MIIAMQEGLDDIENYIRKNNKYKVVKLGDYQGGINALIYAEAIPQIEFQKDQFRLENLSLNYHGCIPQGLLMINAKNKTPKEIIRILEEIEN